MKAKNQISSEADAREKLIIYVYEYLIRANAKSAAQQFLTEIHYDKQITLNNPESQGFLFNWFALFWDLYVSTKTNENKQGSNQVEATSEARAFVDYHMRPVMSPHHQTSPPQPYMNSGSRGYMGGPPPNHSGVPLRPHHGPPPPMNVGPQRVQVGQHLAPPPQMGGGPPPQMGGGPPMTHPHGAPMLGMPNGPHHGPSPMMSGAPSPRYTNHPGPITPVPGGPEPGPSPGLVNRMTPNHSGSPHPHMGVVCPPGGPPSGPMHPGMPSHSPMSHPGPPPPPMQQRGGPGPSGWQGGYGSPAEQCFIPGPPGQPSQSNDFGGMMMNDGTNMMEMKPPVGANNVSNNNSNNNTPANPQQDEYVLAGGYGEPSDQGDDAQIRKIKERLESGDDGDQSGFGMDYGYSAS